MLKFLPLLLLLAGCGLTPSSERLFDPDKEFAKLDSPEVPSVQSSLRHSAEDAMKQNDFSKAAGLFRQLIDHDPANVSYKLGFAESLRRLGEYKIAADFYQKVVEKQPENTDALEGQGLALMGNGDVERAAKVFKQVLTQDTKRWRTYNALGILFAMKGLHQEARAYMKEALNQSPNNASVLNNSALLDAMQKRYSDADKHFVEAARHAEASRRVQIELNHAMVLGIAGDMVAAERLASKHLDALALQNNLGLYAHLANNEELAKSYLNMALSQTPVHYQRAWENLDLIAKGSKGKSLGN